MNENLQEAIKEDDEWLEKMLHIKSFENLHELDVREAIRESKGPFTYQGGYINYHEWHSLGIGYGLMDLAFRLGEGAFIYFYLFTAVIVARHAIRKCNKPRDFVGELAKNFHYFIAGGVIATVFWVEITGAVPPDMSLGLLKNTAALLG